MLLPARTEVARQLRRYRAWERMTLASPADTGVRTTFEDSGYALCVLMGRRCAREAADAAERYLRTAPATRLRERPGRPRPAAPLRPGPPPPAADRLPPAGRKTPTGAA
ncbi:DUF5133 domain-containing protein [Streptomyces sp. SHP 1-2]|uniref:DUF5133 domain-containing protein n=1 Tax=Streptomyces sp. SHP 1-2 TaxID=2769489 RepID=UPI0022389F4C|nr:DUF5133 domain-containing protein [Streptomyces sp. SHP 1-2]MCW5252660.1 DUF5133 domain-containing protein [Streptomyces sp. SHP 1-2]